MALPQFGADHGEGAGLVFFSLPREVLSLDEDRVAIRQLTVTDGGIVAVKFDRFDAVLDIHIDAMLRDLDFLEDLMTLWGFIEAGNPFQFARDGADKAEATLDAAAVLGDARTIFVDDAAGFIQGQRYLIESRADGWQQEAFVAEIVTATSITTQDELQWAQDYIQGDIVRSIHYYSSLIIDQERSPHFELDAQRLGLTLRARSVHDTEVN